MSGRLGRLALGSSFIPGPTGLLTVSGVLYGPTNTMGELSLAGGNITVKPFRAVVQCSLDATAGQYLVVNDADAVFATTAQHATQFRKGLVVIDVDDSQVNGVASSATTDRARMYLLDGALAATSGAAALPALPDSSLALGEYLIPPAGQAVTITPYNPRTTNRNGILPVINDASTLPGHAGAAPVHDGAYRHHPVNGLEVGEGGAWVPAADRTAPLFRARRQAFQYFSANTFTTIGWDTEDIDTHNGYTIGSDGGYACQRAGWHRITAFVTLGAAPPGRTIVRVTKNGGAAYIGASRPNGTTGNAGSGCDGMMGMIVGDKAYVQVYSDAGATWNTDSPDFAPCLFEVQWLRPF
jgi:hypothetical protein